MCRVPCSDAEIIMIADSQSPSTPNRLTSLQGDFIEYYDVEDYMSTGEETA